MLATSLFLFRPPCISLGAPNRRMNVSRSQHTLIVLSRAGSKGKAFELEKSKLCPFFSAVLMDGPG